MITGVPMHQLNSELAQALQVHGLEATLDSDRGDHSSADKMFMRVRVGGDDIVLAMESTDGPEGRARAVKTAEHLSAGRDVKYAVAVC